MPAIIIALFLFARDKTESRPTYLYCCIAALHAHVDAFSILEIGQIALQISRPSEKRLLISNITMKSILNSKLHYEISPY